MSLGGLFSIFYFQFLSTYLNKPAFPESQHHDPAQHIPASREAGGGADPAAWLLPVADQAPDGRAQSAAGAARGQPADAANARGTVAGEEGPAGAASGEVTGLAENLEECLFSCCSNITY